MLAADFVRWMLLINVIGMLTLACFYLRRRQLSWAALLFWCLVAGVLPVLGPFLVIVARPGTWRRPQAELREAREKRRAI